jgi:hypothetical protein
MDQIKSKQFHFDVNRFSTSLMQSLELVPNFGLTMFMKQEANQIYHYVCEMKKQLFFMDLTCGLVDFPLIAIIKFVALLHSVCPLLP